MSACTRLAVPVSASSSLAMSPAAAIETAGFSPVRSEEHTSELQSQSNLVCRLLLEKKKIIDLILAALAHPHPPHLLVAEVRQRGLDLAHESHRDALVRRQYALSDHHAHIEARVSSS